MTQDLAAAPTIRDLLARAIDDLDAGQEVDLIDLERKCLDAALTAALDGVDERAVEVLEWLSHVDNDGHTRFRGKTTSQHAADLITALLAQIAALRAERDALRAERDDAVIKRAAWELSARQMEAERDALRAERDRYLRHLTAGAESLNAYKASADAAEAVAEKLRGVVQIVSASAHQLARERDLSETELDFMRLVDAALTTEADPAKAFDKADWFWRTMDPEDCGDTPEEAINRAMLGRFCVCEIASSYSGPTRYGFIAPVLDPESDDEEFVHFATQQEAIDAAKIRAAITKEKSND